VKTAISTVLMLHRTIGLGLAKRITPFVWVILIAVCLSACTPVAEHQHSNQSGAAFPDYCGTAAVAEHGWITSIMGSAATYLEVAALCCDTMADPNSSEAEKASARNGLRYVQTEFSHLQTETTRWLEMDKNRASGSNSLSQPETQKHE
jgi:hypothetical protein